MDTINNNMVFPFSRINLNAMNVTFGQSDTITNRNTNYISNNDVFKQIDPDLHMHSIRQQCKSQKMNLMKSLQILNIYL